MKRRIAEIDRETKETKIKMEFELDGKGEYSIDTPIGFLNHMLELFVKHGNFNMFLNATGDIDVDYHHLMEDVGIVLGRTIRKSLGDFSGIKRYGNKVVPMDDALSMVTIDLSNRPFMVYNVKFSTEKVGLMDVELFEEFFQAVSNNLKCNLHINNYYGKNSHHIIESIFKAFAHSLKEAVTIAGNETLSTKGVL